MGLIPVHRRSLPDDLRASLGLLRVCTVAYPASLLRGSFGPRPNSLFDLRVCPHPFVGSANDLCFNAHGGYERLRHDAAVLSFRPAHLRPARAAAAQPVIPPLSLLLKCGAMLPYSGTRALEAGISVFSV